MSNFLEDLKQDIINALDFADGSELDEDVVNMVFARENNQLGENARRMLEMGRIKDFLMDNEFEMNDLSHWLNNDFDDGAIHVYFSFESVEVINTEDETFEFDTESKTLYEDVTTKVKELIK